MGNLGTDLSDTDYLKTLRAALQTPFLVSAPFKSHIDGFWLISAAKPPLDAQGCFAGTVAASFNPLSFGSLWRSIELGPDGAVSLFRRNGGMLARSPFHEASMGTNLGNGRVFTDHLPHQPAGNIQNISAIDGVSRMITYSLHKNCSQEGTTSIGMVVFLGDQDSMDDLLRKADLTMYLGKSAGRNTARSCDPAMQAVVAEHDAQEKDLRRGIAMRDPALCPVCRARWHRAAQTRVC